MLLDRIKENDSFVIYGAQVVAYGAYLAIKELLNIEPFCFAVSSLANNPTHIDSIPVREISSVSTDSLIVVAVTELVQKEVLPMLDENGYKNVAVLSQAEEFLLMSQYFDSIGRFPLLQNGDSEKMLSCSVHDLDFVCYEVSNHRDQKLANHPELKAHECAIQAGAALTDIRIAPLTDFTGDNISSKNKQYCEMSASYWVWKNTNHDWKGIEHYRRHILLEPSLIYDELDAVLPLPYICYPDTMHQFTRFVDGNVKAALYKALKDIHPNEYADYISILEGQYQYTYNIVSARREVFDSYCSWFFEITEYMETMADNVPAIADTRALSYVAEVLTNLYFMYNQDKLVIRHVAREIYV